MLNKYLTSIEQVKGECLEKKKTLFKMGRNSKQAHTNTNKQMEGKQATSKPI